MRVPVPIVLLLCLSLVGGLWWFGTRDTDFLTPPSESELTEIRSRVQLSLPQLNQPADAVSTPQQPEEPPPPAPPPPPEDPNPVTIDPELNRPPSLDEYLNLAPDGAALLIDLAILLESKELFQRSLLAWERIIDSTKPNDSQIDTAIAAIQRLRAKLPDWNTDPAQAINVTLHASTNLKTAKTLKPILEETARDLERASAGILKVATAITTKSTKSTTSPPVALWLTGSTKKPRSTAILSFKFKSSKTLSNDTRKTVFQILSEFLAQETTLPTPRAIGENTSPITALNSHISRRSWQELGRKLNTPPKPQ